MLPKAAVVVPHSQSKIIICWKCSQKTLPNIFCEHCNSVLDYPTDSVPSPFDVLGIAETLILDEEGLRQSFYELSKKLHPDRFATSTPPAPQYALRWSTALNRAYKTLKSKEDRTQYIIEKYLGPNPKESKTSIPTDLAETYFEAQDLLSEGDLGPILAFKKELESQVAESQKQWEILANTFDESQDKKATAQVLQQHETREKYLRSMLSDMERRTNS